MSNGFSLNVNGTKLNVQEGMEIKSQPKETQKVLSIFDTNHNGVLDSHDAIGGISEAKLYRSGVFKVTSQEVNYKVNNENGNLKYEANWKLDEDNRIINYTEDYNGDGEIDVVRTIRYDSHGNVLEDEFYENEDYYGQWTSQD